MKLPGRQRRTGNGQPPSQQRVISYYTASRRQLDSFERNTSSSKDDIIRRRQAHHIHQSWFAAGVVVILLVSLAYLVSLSSTPYFIVKGQSYRPSVSYQAIISSAFGHDFRDNIKFLLPSGQLQNIIMKKLPEAQSVSVQNSLFGHHPEVTITTAVPLVIFSQSGGLSFIMSNDGRLLLPLAKTSLLVKDLPTLQNRSAVTGQAGQQFMTPEEAAALAELIAEYRADNQLQTVIFRLSNQPQELDVSQAGRGYIVKYLLDDTILQQYGALRATEKTLLQINQRPAKYIDVRLVTKVYYQ